MWISSVPTLTSASVVQLSCAPAGCPGLRLIRDGRSGVLRLRATVEGVLPSGTWTPRIDRLAPACRSDADEERCHVRRRLADPRNRASAAGAGSGPVVVGTAGGRARLVPHRLAGAARRLHLAGDGGRPRRRGLPDRRGQRRRTGRGRDGGWKVW